MNYWSLSLKQLSCQTQNNKSKRSVDIKKDETLAAGIDKKQTEQIIELFFDNFISKQSPKKKKNKKIN